MKLEMIGLLLGLGLYLPAVASTSSCDFNMNTNVSISDGNFKTIMSNGDFWVNGEQLGAGNWITPTRYTVAVKNWGNLWWVGELGFEGMDSTTVPTRNEVLDANPSNFESFKPLDRYLPTGNVMVNEGSHGKVISPDGDFVVDGKLLGQGYWATNTRFVVFVEAWGNLWWTGELNQQGLNSAVAKTEAEALTLLPKAQEYWTKNTQFQRASSIFVSDGNQKEIKPNGDFVVNGSLLGTGRWVSPSRYTVFVPSWGNRWWIGDLNEEGMWTTTVLSTEEIADALPTNEEYYTSKSLECIL